MPYAAGAAFAKFVGLFTTSKFLAGAAFYLAYAATVVGTQLALDAAMRAEARREAESCVR